MATIYRESIALFLLWILHYAGFMQSYTYLYIFIVLTVDVVLKKFIVLVKHYPARRDWIITNLRSNSESNLILQYRVDIYIYTYIHFVRRYWRQVFIQANVPIQAIAFEISSADASHCIVAPHCSWHGWWRGFYLLKSELALEHHRYIWQNYRVHILPVLQRLPHSACCLVLWSIYLECYFRAASHYGIAHSGSHREPALK